MGKQHPLKKKVELDGYLLERAEAEFNNQPKSAAEVIERWAFLGQAVAEQLTELDQLHLMSRNTDFQLIVKPKN